jgi:hypothetical protein
MKTKTNTLISTDWTLTVIFVLAKLTGLITWSWWWILVCLLFWPLMVVVFALTTILVLGVGIVIVEFWKFFCMLVGVK